MAHNFAVVSPKNAVLFILEVLRNEHTRLHRILMHGDPGVGKSSIMKAVARAMKANLIDLRLMQLDTPDLRGLTMIDPRTGETKHMRPEFLPVYTEDADAENVIIFLDEILAADDGLRKAAFELILDNRVGPHLMGKNVFLVGAGNSAEDGTNVYELDTATADRFLHIFIEPTIEGFIEYGRDNNYHPAILAFINSHPECFMPSKEDRENNNIVRPSPRSLERCSEVLHAKFSTKLFRDIALKGWIGNYSAGLLITDLDDEESRFDLELLIKALPHERVYPKSQFGVYTLAQSLAAYATDQDKLDRAIDVMMSMPDTLNGAIEECKAAFFLAVETKLREWKLLFKYSRDERIQPFLMRTDELIEEADAAYAAQSAGEELDEAA